MYQHGAGVAVDDAAALSWFRKAADQNFPPAMARLGEIYDKGIGVAKDPIEAYKWLVLAAVQKDDDARQEIADLSGRMTKEQIDQAKQAATAWIGSHSQQR
jgi:TPR repeat protein